MSLFPYFHQSPLPFKGEFPYCGMAFDGVQYYFTEPCSCHVQVYSITMEHCKAIAVQRRYQCLCYDHCSHCFWATGQDSPYYIYQLNCHLEEIDSVALDLCREELGIGSQITSLSYSCCDNSLLISTMYSLFRLSLCDKSYTLLATAEEKEMFFAAMALCPGYLLLRVRDCKQFLMAYDDEGTLCNEFLLPAEHTTKGLLFNPCDKKCDMPQLCILTVKNGCYSYLLQGGLCVYRLRFTPCHCNYALCRPHCKEEEKRSCEEGKTEIMHSIALVEAALSHILNAEGEKLQKIIATSNDPCLILAANESVHKTLVSATHLEQALYEKLSAISNICEKCPKDGCKHCCNSLCSLKWTTTPQTTTT